MFFSTIVAHGNFACASNFTSAMRFSLMNAARKLVFCAWVPIVCVTRRTVTYIALVIR